MNIKELQTAIGTTPDGAWGPASQDALLYHFANLQAKAVTADELQAFADRLGVTLKQLRAVAKVESAGGGFDDQGRPKILFERHYFHRLTDGRWSPSIFSNASSGGYNIGSWSKLLAACGRDPDAAFASASWGKFQVMGAHWSKLAYASPYALAYSCVGSEAGHYELLCRFVETFGLLPSMRELSADPDACRAFAKAFNGPGYRVNSYHTKLAGAMA